MSLKTERFVVKKDSGSQWARVVDTATGQQIARYNVLPRKRSLRDGWEDAEKHAKRLNAVSSSSLILEREEAGGETSDSSHLAVPTNGPENLSTKRVGHTPDAELLYPSELREGLFVSQTGGYYRLAAGVREDANG